MMEMSDENKQENVTDETAGGETGGERETPTKVQETAEDMEKQLQTLREEKDQVFAKYQRSLADLQNYQKRAVKERQEAVQRAELTTVERFIFPLIDDMDRALKAAMEHGYKTDDPLVQGVNLVLQHAFGLLKQVKVEPIDAEGKPFDPLFHEGVAEIPAEGRPNNTIVQVLTRGYTHESRTVRPARVVVAREPKPAPKVENDGEQTD